MFKKIVTAASSVLIVAVMNFSVLLFTMYFGAEEDVSGFSKYVLSFSIFSIAVIVLDFGLNTALVRDDTNEKKVKLKLVLNAKKAISLLIFMCSISFLAFNYLILKLNIEHIVAALISAAFYSLWLTERVNSQIEMDFKSYNKTNMQFTLLRIVFLVLFIYANIDVSYGVLFLYGIPAAFLMINKSYLSFFFNGLFVFMASAPQISTLIKYGFTVMLSAFVYTTALNAAVLFYSAHGNAELVAAIGWAIAPLAIVSLIFNVLRPFWLSYTAKKTVGRSMLLQLLGLVLAVAILGALSLAITIAYSDTLSSFLNVNPDWIIACNIAIILVGLNCLFGLVSSLLHKLNLPLLDLKYNIVRLFLVVSGLFVLGKESNVIFVVSTIFIIMVFVEVLLSWKVYIRYRKEFH